ncbi:unnamed protein product [Adineta ricciae]|uniref:Uncharacterized protein n=1 Tax=Adineta ricciae TaxID=249248 RepID=A0A815UVD8_ADIRI|nr:unnamed protein product [Adineta ricciae]
MKQIVHIFICYLITIEYDAQECYVCEHNGCAHPAKDDIKSCSDVVNSSGQDTSGNNFVNDALAGLDALQISKTITPNTLQKNSVCYVPKNSHRICMIMAKGFCEEKKCSLEQFNEIAERIDSIISGAKIVVKKMCGNGTTDGLSDDKKLNISNRLAGKYMSRLTNIATNPKFQLVTCCEGKKCNNVAPSLQSSSTVFIGLLALVSTFVQTELTISMISILD